MSDDFWAGYVSGAAGILIGNPLDLVKTRLQAGNAARNVEPVNATVPASVDTTSRSFRQHFDRAGTLVKGELHSTVRSVYRPPTSCTIARARYRSPPTASTT